MILLSEKHIEEVDTRYGKMFIFEQDEVISRSLRVYGEWAEHEISILRHFIRPETTVIDIGANIGTHALAFSHLNRSVDIVAIEAQPIVFSVLQMNCLINELSNVVCHNMLIGNNTNSVVKLLRSDIDVTNLGASSFVGAKDHQEYSSAVDFITNNDSFTLMKKLESFRPEKPVSLIKIDVEGMELDVIRGGLNLIEHDKPYLFAEQLDVQTLKEIYALLKKLNYNLYWLETHPFNFNNYRGEKENIWWRTEMGILGVPKEVLIPFDLPIVTGLENVIPNKLNAREGISL